MAHLTPLQGYQTMALRRQTRHPRSRTRSGIRVHKWNQNPRGAVQAEDTDSEASSEESIEIEVTRDESEEELEVPEPGSEIEVDTDQDYRNEYSEEDESE